MRVIKSVDSFAGIKDDVLKEDLDALNESAKEFSSFQAGAQILLSPNRMNSGGNPADLILDYIRMITHVDIIKFNQMYRQIMDKKESLDKILEITGRIEALISVACFRASCKDSYAIPEFAGTGYEAKDLIHPLIDGAVPNSIKTDKGVLLTGSNASGKSTFLKTCAINTILAQSAHTVLGKSYRAPFYRIFSSMALRDDIFQGESYYMVEIKSIKRILDAAEAEGQNVLCFVDEVLRGTNTVERIAASTQILKKLADSGVECFAATHDIELTALLKNDFYICHFEGDVSDNDVKFDYILKEGPATTRNAIRLLGVLGYDENIVNRAQEMADGFMKSGSWEKR
jgi:DNA mismatch repair ATPase MutS